MLILLIFAVFLSVAYTTLNKLFAVFLYIVNIGLLWRPVGELKESHYE